MTNYYDANLLDELRDIKRRLLALEKASITPGGGGGASYEGITGATPEGDLPDAAAVAGIYLVVASSGNIYRLIAEELEDGRPITFLRRVGRGR